MLGVWIATKEDTRYRAALERNGVRVEQRGRVGRGLGAVPRHSGAEDLLEGDGIWKASSVYIQLPMPWSGE